MSEWTEESLGRLASIEIGGTPSRDIPAFWASENAEGFPWVSIADLGPRFVSATKERITELGVLSSNVKPVRSGTLMMSFKLTIGRAGIAARDLYTNEAIAAFVPMPRTVDSGFLYYLLPPIARNAVTDVAIKGSTLNKQTLSKLKLRFPKDMQQQRRIAEILSTLDEAIEQTEALIAKHQQIKAGLMHDLFTRGVTPDGHLRPTREQAPDFYKESQLGWIPKEWEVGRLSQYLDPLAGIKPGPFGSSLTKDNYVSAGFRVYGQEQVIAGSLEIGDYFIAEAKFLEMATFEVLADDVLISLVGTVGCVLVVKPPFERGIINPRLMRLRPARSVVLSGFLKHLLLSANVRRQLEILAGGGTMPVINGKIIRRLVIPLLSLDEQFRMVEGIDALDDTLTSSAETLAKLHQQKYGLMHDLLTGRMWVNV
ncbi:restriction endonuclease subunit S [Acidithiobacillus ferridurans]|nr:restriction endonuclease subunit S [Acidithiobacillus ferridurans]